MEKELLTEKVNNKYKLLTEQVSYKQILTEIKEAKTEKDIDTINNKILFTCQNIKDTLEKTFPKEQATDILEDLAAHFMAGLR